MATADEAVTDEVKTPATPAVASAVAPVADEKKVAMAKIGPEATALASFSSAKGPRIDILPDGSVRYVNFENDGPEEAIRQIMEHVLPRTVLLMQVAQIIDGGIKMDAMGQVKLLTAGDPTQINTIIKLKQQLIGLISQYAVMNEQPSQPK